MGIITTYSGIKIDLDKPKAKDINIKDIACHLSKICRFNGAIERFYSVAEHSMFVANLVAQKDRSLLLPALLHDAHEAYLGDVITPLKRRLRGYDEKGYEDIVRDFDKAICKAFSIPMKSLCNPVIKEMDKLAQEIESDMLRPNSVPYQTVLPEGVTLVAGLKSETARVGYLNYFERAKNA